MKKIFLFLIFLVNISFGQAPTLVTDLNQSGFFPYKPIKFGTSIYFMNADERLGSTLWKTDGTLAGTIKVKEGFYGSSNNYFINEYYNNSQFPPWAETVVSNTYLYFVTPDNEPYTYQLWRTDGTTSGTILLKKFAGVASDKSIQSLTDVNGVLYFVGFDVTNGFEVWKTDGTIAGTIFVKDVNPGDGNGFFGYTKPNNLTSFNGFLYFSEDNGVNGEELWKSDGTIGGTVLVKDINAGIGSSSIQYLKNLGGTLYFSADDGINGKELWKSDGTTVGTVLVANLVAGAGSSTPFQFIRFNNLNYFATSNGAFYKTDGTGAGTVLINGINFPINIIENNNSLFFIDDSNNKLYKTDGTTAGTIELLFTNSIQNLYSFNNKVYFSAGIGFSNINDELYVSDGTVAGTFMLKEINPAGASSRPNSFITLNSMLYFLAFDGSYGNFFWKTDGTAIGTIPVNLNNPINGASSPKTLSKIGSNIYFGASTNANGFSLWNSNGTAAGTSNLNISVANTQVLGLNQIVNVNSLTYISAIYANNYGSFLWKTDGTNANTQNVKQFLWIDKIESLNNIPFILAQGIDGIYRLYTTDGTPAGTVSLASLSGTGGNLSKVNNKLYFSDVNGAVNNLWISDGTAAGTAVVKNNIYPINLTDVNGTLYFTNLIGTRKLWKSDGTTAGTVSIKDFGNNYISGLTNANGVLYFSSANPPFSTNYNLWKSDGTTAGTVMVKDIYPGGSASPTKITFANSTIFFEANDGVNGFELWKTDGTSAGTVMVKNINPTGNAFNHDQAGDIFLNVNGTIYFTATDGTNGYELWMSDGTAIGTTMVADINTNGSSYPQNLTLVNNYIYFSANDGINGRELWRYNTSTGIFESIITGNWNTGSTWISPANTLLPTATNTAKINPTHTVNIPNTGNQIKTIQMNGGIINLNGGTLEIKN